MLNTDNKIYFNFSYFALKLLGKGLYSNAWTAISELVANGIDARASNVKIYINMINKKNSIIEIFDDGHGMGYVDLAEKYVLIGKNKRDDKELEENLKHEMMGRKGIGKLAALYLSNKYYLISKTNNESSAWCLDMSDINDSDVPQLNRVDTSHLQIICKNEWDKFSTGTMIRLMNVDMTNIGVQTIEGLKARLADFYLLDALKCNIDVAIQSHPTDDLNFHSVEKTIAFKNMYAFFDNTDIGYSHRLSKSVYFSSNISEIDNIRREVKILPTINFPFVYGEKRFVKENGLLTDNLKKYEMKGWIGIHSSIKKEDAETNDPNYLKNKAYRPTQLRLYVRNKLAVENFLDYIKSTQAFSNYIEGEICFDILDDNELGDIATSNRQGFVEDDERVQLLVSILSPIINTLISTRIKIGNTIKKEEEDYNKRMLYERELIIAKERESKQKVEHERDTAVLKAEGLDNTVKIVSQTLISEKKRNIFLNSVVSSDQAESAKRLHMVRTNTSTIKNIITNISMKKSRNRLTESELFDSLKKISYCAERIFASIEYGTKALFDPKEEILKSDLFEFIKEYCDSILFKYTTIKIAPNIYINSQFISKFSPQDISVILENVASNSIKNEATELVINMYLLNGYSCIDFIDNGQGLSSPAKDEIDSLFDFGKSFTRTGTGIGLFHIKSIIEEMNGMVSINSKREHGFELQVRIPYEI